MRTTVRTFFVGALLCAASNVQLLAAPSDIWTWRNPLPTGNVLSCITYGQGLFVAVGTNGTIETSLDGTNWAQEITSPTNSLTAVTWGGGQFVAVGADSATFTTNVVLTSSDGTNWTPIGNLGTGGLTAVAYGNGNFAAVGYAGASCYYSETQNTWGFFDSGTNLSGVTYGNDQFVAVGQGGNVYNSVTGSYWSADVTSTNISGNNLEAVAYGGGQFVAAAGADGIFMSSDGLNWTNTATYSGNNYYWADSVAYANNEFIVANNETYYPSIVVGTNETNWTPYAEPGYLFSSIAWDGNKTFVGVEADGEIAVNDADITEAGDWSNLVSNAVNNSLNAITYATLSGTGQFLAGGGGAYEFPSIVTSTDGFHWVHDTDPSLSKLYGYIINGMTSGTNSLGFPEAAATVISEGGYLPFNSFVICSSNGVTWTTNFGTSFDLEAIASGTINSSPVFVAVGTGGNVATSSDLATWTTNNVGGSLSSYYAVAYGNGQFTAVGYEGSVAILNASGWTFQQIPTVENLNGVAYGSGLFVAVGQSGVIYTSPNGQTPWIPQTSPTTSTLNCIAYWGNQFVAAGANGVILVSANGTNWAQSPGGVSGNLAAIGYGGTQFIVVGGEDILGAEQISTQSFPVRQYNIMTGFKVITSGPPGTFGVYVSRDLMTWNWMTNVTFTSTTPTQNVTDTNSKNFFQGFYTLGSKGP